MLVASERFHPIQSHLNECVGSCAALDQSRISSFVYALNVAQSAFCVIGCNKTKKHFLKAVSRIFFSISVKPQRHSTRNGKIFTAAYYFIKKHYSLMEIASPARCTIKHWLYHIYTIELCAGVSSFVVTQKPSFFIYGLQALWPVNQRVDSANTSILINKDYRLSLYFQLHYQ